MADVRERRARRSAGFLAERRAQRLRYVALYLELRAGEDEMPRRHRRELEALEESLRAHDIIYFRCTAIRHQARGGAKVRRRKPRGWFAWARRSREGEGEEGEEDGEEEGDTGEGAARTRPLLALSEEERASLLAAMDISAPRALGDGQVRHVCCPVLWRCLTAFLPHIRFIHVNTHGTQNDALDGKQGRRFVFRWCQ